MKRIVLVIFVMALFGVLSASAFASPVGDANNSGEVEKSDPDTIANYVVGNPVTIDMTAANVITDGAITIADALAIENWMYARTLFGDANMDGIVNSSDAQAVADYVVGNSVVINLMAADVKYDGKVDIADSLRIQQYVDGVISTLP